MSNPWATLESLAATLESPAAEVEVANLHPRITYAVTLFAARLSFARPITTDVSNPWATLESLAAEVEVAGKEGMGVIDDVRRGEKEKEDSHDEATT